MGTSLIRNSTSLETYSMTMPRTLRWLYGGGLFPTSEVPLYFLSLLATVGSMYYPLSGYPRNLRNSVHCEERGGQDLGERLRPWNRQASQGHN